MGYGTLWTPTNTFESPPTPTPSFAGDASSFFGDVGDAVGNAWNSVDAWGKKPEVASALGYAAPIAGLIGAGTAGSYSALPFFMPQLVDKLGGAAGLNKDASGNLANAAGLATATMVPPNTFTPLTYMFGRQVNEANRQKDWKPADLKLPTGELLKEQTDENLNAVMKSLGGLTVVDGVDKAFANKELSTDMLKRVEGNKYIRAKDPSGAEYFVKRDKDGKIIYDRLAKPGSQEQYKYSQAELAEILAKLEEAGYSVHQEDWKHI